MKMPKIFKTNKIGRDEDYATLDDFEEQENMVRT